MSALATTMLAIVIQNQVSLRSAPRDSAAQQAVLWQGEPLEVRGERGDFLRVYDHRRERGGYVHASQVRSTSLAAEEAPQLLAIVRFLRDTPGAEALGISYAAAYLHAVPAEALTPEPFDAIGSMAERLARRASAPQPKATANTIAAHLEVVAGQGIHMHSFERNGAVQVCYEGDMYGRVLGMPGATPAQQARAALGLTRHECVDPGIGPTARVQLDQWRAQVLDRVATVGLDPVQKNRLHMRRAGVWSAIAFWQARRGQSPQAAAERALQELAAVNKTELDDADRLDYADAAVRVGSSRPAGAGFSARAGKLVVRTEPGAPGQTCVSVFAAGKPATDPLVRRCTYGIVWPDSAYGNADGSALALAVQPLESWRELWVAHRTGDAWTIDVLPPGSDGPGLGYIELAGWVPGSKRLLVVREVQSEGHYRRRFEVVRGDTLVTEKQAGTPDLLPEFGRWQDPLWRSLTVAMR